ncbi:MAG: hypothetical protein IJI01_00545 [Butyrivibrio sp.]|uniref:hypothetical protein n=1 Tax=Butyrivibrio sp. TaxID=28121 RepID=UPI0025B8316A|nr:hypothetical protein [Butyrivibrio sp.]MBQ6587146.1 hypothetical protein [Butyrivibrio sp.]
MDQITKKIVGKISIILTAMLVVFNLGCVTAKAAPSIQVRNTYSNAQQANTEGKTVVADLQIINLDVPSQGKLLDSFATIKTSQGLYWNIPVIWLDPQGQISSVCIPGIKYIPIFAFYLPDNIVVMNQGNSRGYSIELPEFVGQLYGEKSFLSISNPLSGVTYITTSSIVGYLGSSNGPQVFNSTELKRLSTISRGTGIFDVATAQKELQNGLTQMAEETEDYTDTGAEDSYYVEPENKDSQDQVDDYSDDDQILSSEGNYSDAGETKGGSSEIPVDPKPVEPVVDLLAIHCSDNVIATIGRENLTNLLNLIMNVIEPQAVSQLTNNFQCYYDGAKENALGKEIGLYVYDSRVDHIKDRDYDDANAYVQPKYENITVNGEEITSYGYFMAVNTKSLYKENEDGTYSLINTEIDTLNNTITHELMHAYMDDYVRTGMTGLANNQTEYTADENKFPNWFIEGSASSVENVYSYRYEVFDAMHTDKEDALSDYTVDSLLAYYQNFNDEYYGSPSIDSKNKYYDSDKNTASAYVSGYLACLYLADMAIEKGYVEGKTSAVTDTYDGDKNVYSSAILRSGFDEILRRLHNGTSLDDIIDDISNGTYADTESFQNAFLTGAYNEANGTYENVDASANFCVDVLNYLNKVSKDLTGDAEYVEFANGSVLLDFATDKTSVIDAASTDSEPEQTLYNIVDSKDYVESTVSNESTWATAGTKGPAMPPEGNEDTDASDTPESDDEGQIAARAPEVDAPPEQIADKQISSEEATTVTTQTDPVTNNDADESVPEDLATQPSDEDDNEDDGEKEADPDPESESEKDAEPEPETEQESSTESEPEQEPESSTESDTEAAPEPAEDNNEDSQETSETEPESDDNNQETEQ